MASLSGDYRIEATLSGMANYVTDGGELIASVPRGPLSETMQRAIHAQIARDGGSLFDQFGKCIVGDLAELVR